MTTDCLISVIFHKSESVFDTRSFGSKLRQVVTQAEIEFRKGDKKQ